MSVISLVPKKGATNTALIACLESLLDEARTGKLRGIAYVVVRDCGTVQAPEVGTGWEGGHAVGCSTLLGGTEILKARLIRDML